MPMPDPDALFAGVVIAVVFSILGFILEPACYRFKSTSFFEM